MFALHACLAAGAAAVGQLAPFDHPLQGSSICAAGSQFANATPSLLLCNCQSAERCSSDLRLKLQGLATGPEPWLRSGAGGVLELNIAEDLWSSRRFYFHEDTGDFSELYGSASYVLISEGMGFGNLASGVYAGLSTYVAESGTYLLDKMHFITTGPGTGFSTSELSELHTCKVAVKTVEIDAPITVPPTEDGDGDDAVETPGTNGSNETEVESLYDPPTEVICGRELSTTSSRAKVNVYGYTWGYKWAGNVSSQEYFFYRLRMCFNNLRSWYINQAAKGEGVVDTGEVVEVMDFQQEDGRTFAYWFPKYYWTGNHLDCVLSDLLWDLPKWECPSHEFGAVRVTASTAGDCGFEGSAGVVLNIGFQLDHLRAKDRWFMYSMEANLSGSVAFTGIGGAQRWAPLSVLTFVLLLSSAV